MTTSPSYTSPLIQYIPDWEGRMLAMTYSQFRELAAWNAYVKSLAVMAQMAEDEFWSLIADCQFEVASGVNLDVWGEMVGVPRAGLMDWVYRRFIAAGILIDKNGATGDEIIRIFALVCGVDPSMVTLYSTPPAAFWVQALVGVYPDAVTRSAIARAMGNADATGIGRTSVIGASGVARFDIAGVGFDVGFFGEVI